MKMKMSELLQCVNGAVLLNYMNISTWRSLLFAYFRGHESFMRGGSG